MQLYSFCIVLTVEQHLHFLTTISLRAKLLYYVWHETPCIVKWEKRGKNFISLGMQLYSFCIVLNNIFISCLADDYCGDASGEKGRGKSCRISRFFLVFLNTASPTLRAVFLKTFCKKLPFWKKKIGPKLP